MENVKKRALQKTSGEALAIWLNHSKDSEERQAVAGAIRYMQGNPSKGLPPKDAAMYFAGPLSMSTRIIDGKLDIYPNGDRSYAIFHFWRVCEAGLLGKLRQCSRCPEWFYAGRLDKEFCGKHRRTTEHATIYQQLWRIKNFSLPIVRGRIDKYRSLSQQRTLTKAEQGRQEKAIQREAKLKGEIKRKKAKLKELRNLKEGRHATRKD